jgi:hypothetical protein
MRNVAVNGCHAEKRATRPRGIEHEEADRVALYAAGRAVRFVDPPRLPGLLGGELAGEARIASRKAAARLPAVLSTLFEAYPAAHREVRAAIVAGAELVDVARLHRRGPAPGRWPLRGRAGPSGRDLRTVRPVAGSAWSAYVRTPTPASG